jgi:hypothetical protein
MSVAAQPHAVLFKHVVGGVAELLGGWLAVASVCGRLSEALVKLGFCMRWLVGADRDISAISDR